MKKREAENIEKTYKRVKEVCSLALAEKYPDFDLVKYGSAINGLSITGQKEDSDLDLILVINDALMKNLKQQQG